MQGEPTSFWGKLEKNADGSVRAWHPLADHCADVAACCEALLQRTLLCQRLARLGGQNDLTERQVARLAVLAAVHDVGKFNLGFQNKRRTSNPARTAGHVREFLAMFDGLGYAETTRMQRCLGLDEILTWGQDEAAGSLLVAAVGHHGRPCALSGRHRPDIWQVRGGLDPFAGIEDLTRRCRAWFPAAFEHPESDPFPAATEFQHAYSGLVMLADWLGSDTRYFPFTEDAQEDRMRWARRHASAALAETHIDASLARTSLGAAPTRFEAVAPFQPTAAQAQLLDLPLPTSGSIAILESETGSGKTEAAMARFLRLYQAGQVDGMYFALPTRTAATQIHRRVVNSVQRAFPDAARRPPVVLAVPGYLEADDRTGTVLPNFDVLWNDDAADRFRFRAWAAERPKRYLAGAIAVGTIDQALLSTLTVGHAHLRATALLRQLLVVDEVHASDAYMNALLAEVLDFHVGAGGHALLMSATLGSSTRQRLSTAARLTHCGAGALDAECRRPYPLISHGSVGSACDSTAVPAGPRNKTVRVELPAAIGAPGEIARRALDLASRGAKVLVVRNTVADCVTTQAALECAAEGQESVLFRCKGVAAPHHARFAKQDRERLDEELERTFGLSSLAAPCVVVATQTVQQSLDIDADRLITDLCPMDVLLQRIGRLHRHTRLRPAGMGTPTATVLVPADRDLSTRLSARGATRGANGIGTVYDDLRIIEATWRLLEATGVLEIPAMNRQLVERSTHPEALEALVREKGEAWRKHGSAVIGVAIGDARLAALNVIERSRPFGEYEFPPRELEHRVQTRLGEGDRIVVLPPFRSAFGAVLAQLVVPAHLCRGAGPEEMARNIDPTAGGVRFRFAGSSFVYDRLGLRVDTSLRPADVEETDA